jgi:hypothetical protein
MVIISKVYSAKFQKFSGIYGIGRDDATGKVEFVRVADVQEIISEKPLTLAA